MSMSIQGGRVVDPAVEADRIARKRTEPRSWPVAADCMVRVVDPSADGGSVLVRVTIASQEPLRFAPETGDRLAGTLAGCLEHEDGEDER